MRKFLFLLAPVSAAVALFACDEDSGSSSGGTFDYDSGGYDAPYTPLPDAPVGMDSPVNPDTAPPVDPPVVVSILNVDGTPSANVDVVFNDAAGAVLATVKTGADGKATSPTGMTIAMASALLGTEAQNTDRHVLTWMGVKAGDMLVATNMQVTSDPLVGSYNVTIPTAATGNVVNYFGHIGSCTGNKQGITAGSFPIQVNQSCVRAGNANGILVKAADGNNAELQYAFVKNVAAPTNPQTPVNASVGAFAATSSFVVNATNRPQNFQGYTELDELSGTVAFRSNGYGYFVETGQITFNGISAGFDDAVQTMTEGQVGVSTHMLFKRFASGATTGAIDLGTLLPTFTDVQLPKGTDYKRQKVTWTSASPFTGTDGGVITLRWSEDESSHGWTILVPPSATDATLPALPASAAKWLPPDPGDAAQLPYFTPDAFFVESDLIPSFDAFRTQAGRLLPFQAFGMRNVVMPAAGTLRLVRYQPNFD